MHGELVVRCLQRLLDVNTCWMSRRAAREREARGPLPGKVVGWQRSRLSLSPGKADCKGTWHHGCTDRRDTSEGQALLHVPICWGRQSQ